MTQLGFVTPWYVAGGDRDVGLGVPFLSSLSAVPGSTSITVTVSSSLINIMTTNAVYVVVTQSSTQPSIGQITAGNDHTNSAADAADSVDVSSGAGESNPIGGFDLSGLSPGTYYVHVAQYTSKETYSNIVSSGSLSVGAASAGGVLVGAGPSLLMRDGRGGR